MPDNQQIPSKHFQNLLYNKTLQPQKTAKSLVLFALLLLNCMKLLPKINVTN